MTTDKTNIQKEIEQMLLECKALGIYVIFVSGTPGLTGDDHKQVIISKNHDDQTIKNTLKKAIVHYFDLENKECPGLKYEEYYNSIPPASVQANIDQQLERIKNKYIINPQI